MQKKIFSEKIIVVTSQYFTTELTRRLFESLKQDNVKFTFLVLFDGTPLEKILDLSDIVDISIISKQEIHSLPEIFNILHNTAKSTDAEYLLYSDNDIEYKKGSLASIFSLIDKYDVVSPVKIDDDREKFDTYYSEEKPTEVIGWNDSAWFVKLDKIRFSPFDRDYGPFGFEDALVQFQLYRDNASFVVDNQAVAFHHCSQDTAYCFTRENRKKYSQEWDLKAETFVKNNGEKGKWFLDNVIKNAEGVKRFGFPVYILK